MKTRRCSANEHGTALIWALLFVIITSGLVVSHTTFLASRRGERDARYTRTTMADTFARSGLQDAVGWFHRRSNQPITQFDPVYEPTANPPRIETIDPSIGLVREFEISGNLWGRYEVRHEEAKDISTQRGDLTPGSVWELGVRAHVYRKRDASKAYDESPNQLVGSTAMKSEIRWLRVNPPVPAALCVDNPGNIEIGPNTTIDGGPAIGIGFRDPAATEGWTPSEPTIDPNALVTGVPAQLASPTYDAEAGRVFSMRLDELRAYTDVLIPEKSSEKAWDNWWDWAEGQDWSDWGKNVDWSTWDGGSDSGGSDGGSSWGSWGKDSGTDGTSDTTDSGDSSSSDATSPTNQSIQAQLVYTENLKLTGELTTDHSLLVVDGDLTDEGNHSTSLNGIVYVTGDVKIDSGKLEVQGVMIVRGKADVGGSSTVKMSYDPEVVENVRRLVGKYRKRRGSDPQNP